MKPPGRTFKSRDIQGIESRREITVQLRKKKQTDVMAKKRLHWNDDNKNLDSKAPLTSTLSSTSSLSSNSIDAHGSFPSNSNSISQVIHSETEVKKCIAEIVTRLKSNNETQIIQALDSFSGMCNYFRDQSPSLDFWVLVYDNGSPEGIVPVLITLWNYMIGPFSSSSSSSSSSSLSSSSTTGEVVVPTSFSASSTSFSSLMSPFTPPSSETFNKKYLSRLYIPDRVNAGNAAYLEKPLFKSLFAAIAWLASCDDTRILKSLVEDSKFVHLMCAIGTECHDMNTTKKYPQYWMRTSFNAIVLYMEDVEIDLSSQTLYEIICSICTLYRNMTFQFDATKLFASDRNIEVCDTLHLITDNIAKMCAKKKREQDKHQDVQQKTNNSDTEKSLNVLKQFYGDSFKFTFHVISELVRQKSKCNQQSALIVTGNDNKNAFQEKTMKISKYISSMFRYLQRILCDESMAAEVTKNTSFVHYLGNTIISEPNERLSASRVLARLSDPTDSPESDMRLFTALATIQFFDRLFTGDINNTLFSSLFHTISNLAASDALTPLLMRHCIVIFKFIVDMVCNHRHKLTEEIASEFVYFLSIFSDYVSQIYAKNRNDGAVLQWTKTILKEHKVREAIAELFKHYAYDTVSGIPKRLIPMMEKVLRFSGSKESLEIAEDIEPIVDNLLNEEYGLGPSLTKTVDNIANLIEKIKTDHEENENGSKTFSPPRVSVLSSSSSSSLMSSTTMFLPQQNQKPSIVPTQYSFPFAALSAASPFESKTGFLSQQQQNQKSTSTTTLYPSPFAALPAATTSWTSLYMPAAEPKPTPTPPGMTNI
jgi:hypothetical protein